MKKLYEKSELGFALMWIGIYCLVMSIFDGISRSVGVESSATAIFSVVVSMFLFVWLKKNCLHERFGLCSPTVPARSFLFYIPLILITSQNLWNGVELQYDAVGTFCFVIKMLCVGFLEELIFRGFLFKAMCRDSIGWAVVVSSMTFGLGHILNLVNGSGMGIAENLVQIICAVLIGFLYVIIFWRGGSLWPCIISHGVFNSLSAFSGGNESIYQIMILCGLVVSYTLVLLKTLPRRGEHAIESKD
ncbi:MAG: CPBP family intramembrane metalloprotease [Ruminiclostridium sp.]|nr:CPBP family intramembrane metalloprotease [Ruminiclostridium sp.]